MLYIHATTSGSWFSQKENKNIGGRSLISPLQKTSIFIPTHKETLQLSFLTSYKILQFSFLKGTFSPG